MSSSFTKLSLWFTALIVAGCASALSAQSSKGTLTGKVSFPDDKPAPGITVVITNQTSSETFRRQTRADGTYSLRLQPGAYRISVESPHEAHFDRGKLAEYGSFANVICDETKKQCPTLQNVIIDGGGERKIDFALAEPPKETEKPALPDRREVLDRWRIAFPEYERYGDRGARGRDVPFKRGN